MTVAVEREVSDSYFFSFFLILCPWGIRLKLELDEVCINPKGIFRQAGRGEGEGIRVQS
jgi:hypothetical protein